MRKILKSSVLTFAIFSAVLLNGCDIFENFLFNLPVSVTIISSGTTNPSGSQTFKLDTVQTYQDYKDKLNSIVYVEAYIKTQSITDTSIRGNGSFRLYAGTNSGGQLLAEHVANNIRPADYMSPNPAYKVELTPAQITAINQALADDVTEFYGEYSVAITSGGLNPPNVITVRIDILFQVDADL
jgi:hypothetical protein